MIEATIRGETRHGAAGDAVHTGKRSGKADDMKRNRTAFAGIVCGFLCAACVLAYTQGVRGEAEAARAEALARYGGEQLEVCVCLLYTSRCV